VGNCIVGSNPILSASFPMLPIGSIFYAFLRPKTPFWKSNKGIKNAACNACIGNDTSSPSQGSPQVIPF
jgi:hypothetical protein